MRKLLNLALWLIVTLGMSGMATAQQTVGLFQNDPRAFDGFTMLSKGGLTYLIDNAGLVVHTWDKGNDNTHPGYLLDNGNLLAKGRTSFAELTWEGTVIWEYDDPDAHHDIEPLPNGNVLMISRDSFSNQESIDAGRDPSMLDDDLKPLAIYEIAFPGVIVWEWHLWDHLVQDHDKTKDNFAMVDDHPELVDINYIFNTSNNWNHTNAMEYNPDLDQIIVSVRHFCEAWVIDHSTTTAEAASHAGGNSGMGGDILYRWGNPETYRAGDLSDRQLFGQHDTQWIKPGLPGAGNILVFNNGGSRFNHADFSTIDEIVPPVDGFTYSHTPGSAYEPTAPTWTYEATPNTDFFSVFISSVQRLPNNNTLIDSGASGTIFEVTRDGQVVWEYVNPVTDGGILGSMDIPGPQGPGQTNSIFRATRYGRDHPAFAGRDLTPTGELETWDNYANLTLQSTAGGSMTSRPEGTYAYGEGQLATLIAGAEPGFVFTGWTVESGSLVIPDAGAVHTTVPMGGSDSTVQANFVVAPSSIAACGAGTVNASCGPVEDVLLLNGMAGGLAREISLTQATPVSLTLAEPGSRQGDGNPTNACIYVWLGEPSPKDEVNLPRGLGPMCFGLFVNATRSPIRIWNSLDYEESLGIDNVPGPIPVIPDSGVFELASLPSGLGRAVTVTVQGIIEDNCSQGTVPFSVTNGFVVKIQ